MKRSIMVWGFLCVCWMFWGCGNESPTSSQSQPTVQSITVTSSSDMLHIGISETFRATVTMSDGSTKAVTSGVWGGNNPNVATVDASTGRVTIVGSGNVSIYVDYKGRRGSKSIRGLPNYQGTWSGSYYVVSCNGTSDFARVNFCSNFPYNSVWPTDLNLTQDSDRVQGRFFLGALGADTSGPIQTDGQLLLTGAVHEGIFTVEVSWQLQSETPGRITGSLNQLFRATGWFGNGRLSCNVRNLNRTSTVAMALPPSGPRLLNPTLEDLIRALVGK